MTAGVLVQSAGTGAASNLIRSLQTASGVRVVGSHADRFVLKKSPAERNYLTPPATDAAFGPALLAIAAREQIDLIIPGNDEDVRALSDLRVELGGLVFLPAAVVVELCQDKCRLSARLREQGVPAPLTYPVADLDQVDEIFQRFPGRTRLWCRLRTGSGSRGAVPVARPAQAKAWIDYWREMRGVAVAEFSLCDYLPGRDFAAQALWRDGEPALIKVCERLSYFGGGSQPSGISSTPALARLVAEPGVVDVCHRAIRALDRTASGVFSIDLKEDARGQPCITEINAGRFCMITSFFDQTGHHNMAASYVRLARGEWTAIADPYEAGEDHYLVRDLDTLPGIYHADELFEGIETVDAVPRDSTT